MREIFDTPGIWREVIFDNEAEIVSGNFTWGGYKPNQVWDPKLKDWVDVKQ